MTPASLRETQSTDEWTIVKFFDGKCDMLEHCGETWSGEIGIGLTCQISLGVYILKFRKNWYKMSILGSHTHIRAPMGIWPTLRERSPHRCNLLQGEKPQNHPPLRNLTPHNAAGNKVNWSSDEN